jgi:hypothetical protein
VARTAARSDQAVLDFLAPTFASRQKVESKNSILKENSKVKTESIVLQAFCLCC